MNGTLIQKHKTSYGTDAGTLLLALFLLAIFRGNLPAVTFGFTGISLIFWLTEKSSAYFRRQAAQLTTLLALSWAVNWVLNLLSNLINAGRISYLVQNLLWIAESVEYYRPEDLLYELFDIFKSVFAMSGVFTVLTSLVNIAVFVFLIMGAVNAARHTDWEMPVVYPLACKLDEKLHRGMRTF